MLGYLVTSSARRQLLRLLWLQGATGSVRALAALGGLSYAATHRELEGMRAAGLATAERAGAALLYRANTAHPQARLLRSLLAGETADQVLAQDDRTRAWLRAVGAPLVSSQPLQGHLPTLEHVLAAGLELAHRDASVASVLPALLWRQRHQLDLDRLVAEATKLDERKALGFYLDLTAQLGSSRQLAAAAAQLQDHRRARTVPFFHGARDRYSRAQAAHATPALAKRWGFSMNLSLDTFRQAFRKHAHAAAP